jgi:hypothetical protein
MRLWDGHLTGCCRLPPHCYQILGRAVEIARALGSPAGGAEHLFLGMLHDGGWAVSVISPLADLRQAEAAMLGMVNSPGYSPPPAPEHGPGQPGPPRLTASGPGSQRAIRTRNQTAGTRVHTADTGVTPLVIARLVHARDRLAQRDASGRGDRAISA